MSKYHDDTTEASNPGGVRLAPRRLAEWRPSTSMLQRIIRRIKGDELAEYIDEHLRLGDSRAAVVVNRSPLLVAAYTDELDCVAILKFPAKFVGRFSLEPGTRLLAVNTYTAAPTVAPDLVPGPSSSGRWQNFYPLIAEFLSEDLGRIAQRKSQISEPEWQRCLLLGREYLRSRPGGVRDGSPLASSRPARAA